MCAYAFIVSSKRLPDNFVHPLFAGDLDHQVSCMWVKAVETREDLVPVYYNVR